MTINKGETKRMIFRFKEPTTSTYDVLFEFINDMTGEEIYFSQIDLSGFPDKYNEFEFTEGVNNVYNGSAIFETGHWRYTVYQMPKLSPVSLDKSQAIKVIDIGRLDVRSENEVDGFDENDNKNNVTFE